MTEVDWSSLLDEAASGGVLPDGLYPSIVTSAIATTASTGKLMYKTKFRVIEGPKKDTTVFGQFVVSPESAFALQIFFRHMAAFGLDTNFFASKPSNNHVAQCLMNRGVNLELGTRAWQGVDRNEIKNVTTLTLTGPPPPGLVTGPPPLESDAVSVISASSPVSGGNGAPSPLSISAPSTSSSAPKLPF